MEPELESVDDKNCFLNITVVKTAHQTTHENASLPSQSNKEAGHAKPQLHAFLIRVGYFCLFVCLFALNCLSLTCVRPAESRSLSA